MKFTVELSRRVSMRSTHDVTADFHSSTSSGAMDSVKDSDKRECVLIREMTLDNAEGLKEGRFLSRRWSLIRVRSKRGLSSTSSMPPKWSKAAIVGSNNKLPTCNEKHFLRQREEKKKKKKRERRTRLRRRRDKVALCGVGVLALVKWGTTVKVLNTRMFLVPHF